MRWSGRGRRVRCSCGCRAAQAGRVGGQVLDVGVGEVGGLDPARDAGFGQQPADPPGQRVDDEPRRPGEEILSTKALLLLIIAGGVAYLWVYNPVVGAAVLAGITVLT